MITLDKLPKGINNFDLSRLEMLVASKNTRSLFLDVNIYVVYNMV